MLLTFWGQYIFDNLCNPVGLELLARGETETHNEPMSPIDIFAANHFEHHHYFALDMQIISHLSNHSNNLKRLPISYVFVNFSDSILNKLTLGDDSQVPFSSIVSLQKKIAPITLVIEVNEKSRIRPEHLTLIMKRLQQKGIKFAQDDFDSSRTCHINNGWDFIKVNYADLLEHKSMLEKYPLIIERCPKSFLLPSSHFKQGFEMHTPETIESLIKTDRKTTVL
jgi:hypothetical protein